MRHVIDELAAPEIERGIRLERVNMRGVYSKAVAKAAVRKENWRLNIEDGLLPCDPNGQGQLALWMRLPRNGVVRLSERMTGLNRRDWS